MDYAHYATGSDSEFVMTGLTLLEGSINAAILDHGRCVLGLSGGSTPRPVYEALGKSKEIDWSKVWLFLVDERHVSAEESESNTRLIRETLAHPAGLPPVQFQYPAQLPIEDWLKEYTETLADLLQGKELDIVVLGMGGDGHIASLFPPVPEEGFGPNLAVHTTTDRFAVHDRISVTMPVLSGAREKIFLLRGEEKKNIWNEMLRSSEDEHRWPAKAVLASGNVSVITQW